MNVKYFLMLTAILIAFSPFESEVFAQCHPLTSFVCMDTISVHLDFSFNQSIPWWTVVGVVPTDPDDKDIYLFTGCAATGTYLAGSGGTSGTDFIVGDFNHNPYATYYPRVQYGSPTDPYTVFWNQGGKILPISAVKSVSLGIGVGGCNLIDIWDVYLEADAEYEFRFSKPVVFDANMSLFRNPGATAYWAGRSASEFEVTGFDVTHYYAPPAADWYGLVVFQTWKHDLGMDSYIIDVEKLLDCQPLESGTCVENILYSTANGPKNDYSFDQPTYYWSAVSVIPTETDFKWLTVYSECDQNGSSFGTSAESAGEASFIVADFNHSPLGTYYPVADFGEVDQPFTIEWEQGSEVFPMPGEVMGSFDAMSSVPNIVQIWDVYMEAGKQYEFFFYEFGDADPHLALFHNGTTADYWAPRSYAEWEITGSGGTFQTYNPPTTNFYGLVAFANTREQWGLYQIQFQELNDCIPLASEECVVSSQWPRDFSFTTTGNYWAVIGIIPGDEDYKQIYATTQCDGKGTNLASSTTATGTNFVVGDFNHTPTGTYYAHSYLGDTYENFVISCDMGTDIAQDIFPLNEVVAGAVEGVGAGCGRLKIWDVYLETGQTYTVSFTRSGTADIRLALYANPGSGTFWSGRPGSEWEMSAAGNLTYTAPSTDWYGLVVFANRRDVWGNYTIRITPEGATAIEILPEIPEQFALYQNAPNPFNPSTIILYDVPVDARKVSLKIYDVRGQVVRTLVEGFQTPGEKSATWNSRNDDGMLMPSGVYFCRLNAGDYSQTRKMLLMK
jgi:hypothetical protein